MMMMMRMMVMLRMMVMMNMSNSEVPAEEATSSKTGIEEEERGVEDNYRGNPTSWSSQVVCVILSGQVPHLDAAISSSSSQKFSTGGKPMKSAERNWASVDTSESSCNLSLQFSLLAILHRGPSP